MGAIRGAVCCENTVCGIAAKAVTLVESILTLNNLDITDIDAVIFSSTEDLDACYPAESVRKFFNAGNVAFMCLQEMRVENSLDHCLRVCVLTQKLAQDVCKHCYLGRASDLRKDL